MENITEYIIGGLFAGIPIILKVIAAEYSTNFVKELFKCETNEKASQLFNLIVIVLLVIGLSLIAYPSFTTENSSEEIVQGDIPVQKTDAEVALEAGEIIFNEIQEGIQNKKEKNEKIIANRAKRLVYQISDIKDNEESVLMLYEKLVKNTAIDSSRIFVFRIKRKKYFLYIDEGYSEDQITEESLANFKTQIVNVEPVVNIIDLMQYCKAKEIVTQRKPLKFKKQKIEIPCYYCD